MLGVIVVIVVEVILKRNAVTETTNNVNYYRIQQIKPHKQRIK